MKTKSDIVVVKRIKLKEIESIKKKQSTFVLVFKKIQLKILTL